MRRLYAASVLLRRCSLLDKVECRGRCQQSASAPREDIRSFQRPCYLPCRFDVQNLVESQIKPKSAVAENLWCERSEADQPPGSGGRCPYCRDNFARWSCARTAFVATVARVHSLGASAVW